MKNKKNKYQKQKSKKTENKNDKFKRVASRRVNEILEHFRLLGQLANKGNYEYSEKDIQKIFVELSVRMAETQAKFELGGKVNFLLERGN